MIRALQDLLMEVAREFAKLAKLDIVCIKLAESPSFLTSDECDIINSKVTATAKFHVSSLMSYFIALFSKRRQFFGYRRCFLC